VLPYCRRVAGLGGDFLLGRHRAVAGLDHGIQRLPLMAHVAFDGFDQVGNQIVAAFELHVDLSEGVLDAVPGDHQPVVDAHQPEREQEPDAQEHEQGDDDGTHWP
jgi:hypothetical protein